MTSIAAKHVPLVTDGRSVFVQESGDGSIRIVHSATDPGSTPTTLETSLTKPDLGSVAPDGNSLLLRDLSISGRMDQPLYVQPLPNGPARRVGQIEAYDSAWTPDQKQIIFSKESSVYLTESQGQNVQKLFDVPGRAYWFRWQPGGGELRFSVYDSKHTSYRIWRARSLGDRNPEPIDFGLPMTDQQANGNWSPDGKEFYFQASVGGFFQLFAQSGGGRSRQLTSGSAHTTSPLPLKNGSQLLALVQNQRSEVVKYDGSKWRPLLEGVAMSAVSYSPDGKWLAYIRLPERALWRCALPKCDDHKQLTAGSARIAMPTWSPDGAHIACMARLPAGKWRAIILSADGSVLKDGITGGADSEADPSWSPNSEELAFGTPPNPDTGAESKIRIWNRKSGEIRAVPDSKGFNTPHWSPDGRYLAAVRWGSLELALFEFASGKWKVMEGSRAGYLNWDLRNNRLLFRSLRPATDGSAWVQALNPVTLAVTTVARLEGFRKPAWSFGDWVGIDPSGAPLALRDLSTDEVVSWNLAH
jgi:Tol biopolymer transport system component